MLKFKLIFIVLALSALSYGQDYEDEIDSVAEVEIRSTAVADSPTEEDNLTGPVVRASKSRKRKKPKVADSSRKRRKPKKRNAPDDYDYEFDEPRGKTRRKNARDYDSDDEEPGGRNARDYDSDYEEPRRGKYGRGTNNGGSRRSPQQPQPPQPPQRPQRPQQPQTRQGPLDLIGFFERNLGVGLGLLGRK